VSRALTPYYYTQVIGDARHPPTLLAAANFQGFAVIGENKPVPLSSDLKLIAFSRLDVDPYIDGGNGAQW